MIFHFSSSGAGDTTVFTPQAGKSFQVVGWHLVSAGTATITWKRGTTAMGGAQSLTTGVPHTVLPNGLDRVGIYKGDVGEALVITQTGAVQVSGWIDVDHI